MLYDSFNVPGAIVVCAIEKVEYLFSLSLGSRAFV
jgi:hypothetical protein